eukprot:1145757-Pelagomonas_calceolata.AAC.21
MADKMGKYNYAPAEKKVIANIQAKATNHVHNIKLSLFINFHLYTLSMTQKGTLFGKQAKHVGQERQEHFILKQYYHPIMGVTSIQYSEEQGTGSKISYTYILPEFCPVAGKASDQARDTRRATI